MRIKRKPPRPSSRHTRYERGRGAVAGRGHFLRASGHQLFLAGITGGVAAFPKPMAVERKYERDIDLLLAEELSVNAAFADWLKEMTQIAGTPARVVDVFVSKSNSLGESDLIAIYEMEDSRRFALMIEDKVDAPLQPRQAERYRMRAEQEVKLGTCASYAVLLCAPRNYLEQCDGISGFDGSVAFETIAAFLSEGKPTPRDLYRASFLEAAATRRVNIWVRDPDDQTDEFWDAAYKMATSEFPILEMKPLKVSKGCNWITFRPRDIPTQPRQVYVSAKGERGQIDLTFGGVTAHRFHELVSDLLEPDMTVHQTSASTAVRLEVGGFQISDGVKAGMPRVRAAFEACERLIRFYRLHRVELVAASDQAATEKMRA